MSVSRALKTTDQVFSWYIRRKYADNFGRNTCITCGSINDWQKMDAGHYVSRGVKSLRFDERNVHPQCQRCNRFREGVKDEYALKLQEMYGKNILKELQKEKNKTKQWTEQELKVLRKELREKMKKFV